ncbi:MAG: prepilin peptidase [Elusimicrobiaceae bacterium]|nr:prepilin peptidase [Elusimicrobiaceae bacterium]
MEIISMFVLFFVFGAVIGSFLNVCIYRLPAKISIVWPPSHCPKCDTRIKWYDNIPILSYLILRGKCRKCKEKISIQYPIVEFLTGALTTLFFFNFGLSAWTFCASFCLYVLITLSFIDLDTYTIPDILSIGLIFFGLAVCWLNPAFSGNWLSKFTSSIIGASVGFFGSWGLAVICSAIIKKEALGGGDIKLMGAIGALSGCLGMANALMIASIFGLICFAILGALKKTPKNGAIPFGPFLSVGLIVNLLFPHFNLLLIGV